MTSSIESDRRLLVESQAQGLLPTLRAYFRLSGPGWLQSAITLGGGSLANSLILGIVAGYTMMWLQPIAMLLGIVMLSAIGYVALSTGQRPFGLINERANPVMGWSWALACGAANIVWCLPQFALANEVLSQNLLPGLLAGTESGSPGWIVSQATDVLGGGDLTRGQETWGAWLATHANKLTVVTVLLALAVLVTWQYDRGGRGIWLFETLLKIMVALIVICFLGVVIVMTWQGQLPWAEIFSGFVPNVGALFSPAPGLEAQLDKIANAEAYEYWRNVILSKQQDVVFGAAATAVGINMTFLFPYSLLRKGWTREFRGLSVFDLCTGMFIPFMLVTSFIVIASAARFHARVADDFIVDGKFQPPTAVSRSYQDLIDKRNAAYKKQLNRSPDFGPLPTMGEVSQEEKELAAMLVSRKAIDLSGTLRRLTGKAVGEVIFGVGVLAMTFSTIMMLMLISGFTLTEVLGLPPGGWGHRLGTLISGIGGAFGPFIWRDASAYLAVPTSVFGFILLPLAYVTFFILMNQRSILGDDMPRGAKRLIWNVLMFIAAAIASVGAIYMIWNKAGYAGIAGVAGLVLLAVLVHLNRLNTKRTQAIDDVSTS